MDFKEYVLSKVEKTYGQYYKSYEEFKEHIESGDVTIPFSYLFQLMDDFNKETLLELPSAHKIGDEVKLAFGEAGGLNNAEIINIKFTPGKVLYDIELLVLTQDLTPEEKEKEKCKNNPNIGFPTRNFYTRIFNIDSAFVTKIYNKK